MYHPTFRTKKNGVPILSKNEIEEIAERMLWEYNPKVMETPSEIDIDEFATYHLGLSQDFQYLSHNGSYLGIMVFNDTNRLPVYIPQSNKADYLSVKARTVIIDNSLLTENQEHRYRYTMGHECSHDVLHHTYFSYNPNQLTIFEHESEPMIRCRIVDKQQKQKSIWTDKDWMEWQANYMSSALLMPRSNVWTLVQKTSEQPQNIRNYLNVQLLVNVFNVSEQAAEYRLKDLGLMDKAVRLLDIFAFIEMANPQAATILASVCPS